MVVIWVYGPNDDVSQDIKDSFLNELMTILNFIDHRKEEVLLGNFIGRVDSQTNSDIVGPFGGHMTSDNGEQLDRVLSSALP